MPGSPDQSFCLGPMKIVWHSFGQSKDPQLHMSQPAHIELSGQAKLPSHPSPSVTNTYNFVTETFCSHRKFFLLTQKVVQRPRRHLQWNLQPLQLYGLTCDKKDRRNVATSNMQAISMSTSEIQNWHGGKNSTLSSKMKPTTNMKHETMERTVLVTSSRRPPADD